LSDLQQRRFGCSRARTRDISTFAAIFRAERTVAAAVAAVAVAASGVCFVGDNGQRACVRTRTRTYVRTDIGYTLGASLSERSVNKPTTT
jgi:hypothetical protein